MCMYMLFIGLENLGYYIVLIFDFLRDQRKKKSDGIFRKVMKTRERRGRRETTDQSDDGEVTCEMMSHVSKSRCTSLLSTAVITRESPPSFLFLLIGGNLLKKVVLFY